MDQRLGILITTLLLATAAAPAREIASGVEEPAGPFASAIDAFVAAFIASGIGLRGYFENREYATVLYAMPDGRWWHLAPQPGSRTGSRIAYDAVPDAAVQVVGAHTHGQARMPESPDQIFGTEFSLIDLAAGERNFQLSRGRISGQFVLTSEFRIIEQRIERGYDARTGTIGLRGRVLLVAEQPDDPLDRRVLPTAILAAPLEGAPYSRMAEAGAVATTGASRDGQPPAR